MITLMRRYFKGRTLQIIAWLTILSVVGFWGGAGFMKKAGRGHGPEGWIAKVNDQEVCNHDYMRAVHTREHYISLIRNQFGTYADVVLQMQGLAGDPRILALQSLITNALLDGVAKDINLNLQEGYIRYKMADPTASRGYLEQIIPVDMLDRQGGIDQSGLNNYLRRAGISGEQFDQMLSEAMERELIIQLADVAHYVPSIASRERFQLDYANKKFSILTVPFEQFLKKEQAKEVAEADLKAFFERESKNYMAPEKRVARIWMFEPSNYNVTVDEQEVEDYYKEHQAEKYTDKPEQIQIRRILFAAKDGDQQDLMDKAQKVYEQVKQNPDLFAQKAKELSADKETAKNGGLVPFFAKGSKEERLEQASFLLREDNDIAEPFVSREGVELIQRVSRKPAAYKPLASVRNDIKQLLSTRKFQELFVEDMRPIMDQPELDEQDLKAFIDKRGGVLKQVSVDELDKSKTARVIFTLNEKGMNCFLDNGKGLAVQLMEVQRRFLPPLETIKDKVIADLHKERAYKVFDGFMHDLVNKATTQTLEDLAKTAGGTVSTVDSFDPQDAKRIDELRKNKMPVDAMGALEAVGGVKLHFEATKGVIVRLDKVQPFDEKNYLAKKAELAQKLDREEAYYVIQGFVASLYRNAKIETNNSLLEINEELAI